MFMLGLSPMLPQTTIVGILDSVSNESFFCKQ